MKNKPEVLYNICAIFLIILIQSCSTTHPLDYTPPKPGKYPNFTEERKLIGTLTKYRTCFHVHYYNIDVKVDPEKQTIGGTVKISSTATTDFDTLQIDLYKNMNIRSLTFEGKELKYNRKEGAVFIAMPHKIKAGENFDLVMQYDGSPIVAKKPPWAGGTVWKKDENKNPWDGVACETEGASLWWPCKDHNSDEADSVSISISVPKGLMAVSNGVLKDSTDLKNGWEKFHWFISYPINNYDVTYYVGKFKLWHDTYTGITGKTLNLSYYLLPYHYEIGKAQFEQAKDILKFYETTFGEYPWYRDGYKLVESPFEGMEHQTAIAYGSGFKNFPGLDFDYILVHESAHEWWGNAVTASDFSDVWLQEGFATYSEALYVEKKYGKDMYNQYLGFYRKQNINKRPIVGPVGVRYFDYHDEDVYTKGAGTLQTLRAVINNDSVFFDILKTYFKRNKYKEVTSQDFINVVNEKTGSDYSWFFKQYLHDRRIPILEFYWNQNGEFTYHWINCDLDFKMPVVVDCGSEKQVLNATTTYQSEGLCRNSDLKKFMFDVDDKLYKLQENKAIEQALVKKGK